MVDFLTKYTLMLVMLMACMAWIFVGRLAWTDWHSNAEGRYLMKSKTALALIFTMALVFRVFDPIDEVRYITSALLYTWITYTLAELLVLQTRALRETRDLADAARKERHAPADPAR